jgi:hypothetical protein
MFLLFLSAICDVIINRLVWDAGFELAQVSTTEFELRLVWVARFELVQVWTTGFELRLVLAHTSLDY